MFVHELSSKIFLEILFNPIDGVKKICYICDEVIDMVKPNIAGKLKNLARDLKDEDKSQGGVRKLGDAVKQNTARKKESTDGGKLSGRKN